MKTGDRSGPPNPSELLWDIGPSPTAKTVRLWFEEAWPNKSRYPDRRECQDVAQSIHTIRAVADGRKARKSNVQDEKAFAAATYGAGVFLKHEPSLSQLLQAYIERLTITFIESDDQKLHIIDHKAHAKLTEVFENVKLAQRALIAALPTIKQFSAKHRDVDRARWIKQHVQEAWRLTNGTCPRSNSEDGAIVRFVQLALVEIGDHRERGAIAQALKRSENGS